MLATLLLASALADQPLGLPCRVLLASKQAGDTVFAEDLAPSPCPDKLPERALRYDRGRGLAIAHRDLPANAELGLAYAPARPGVLAGETISMRAKIGHVMVHRDATALQTARQGEKFFARSSDGAIFVAPPIGSASSESGQ